MTHDPIAKAIAANRWWVDLMDYFDALEIHPIRDTSWNDAEQGPRPFDSEDNETWCEPCAPEEAHFWSIYGHLRTGGVDYFEDFATEAEARALAQRLLSLYPHLREYGAS